MTGQAAIVAGGSWITVTGDYATVGGGTANTAGGSYATIPGGTSNTASGVGSFAMDAIGVSLAAAQGLYELSHAQAARIQALKAENAAQQEQIDELKARLAALEQTVKNTPVQHTGLPVPGWLLAGLLLGSPGCKRPARRSSTCSSWI